MMPIGGEIHVEGIDWHIPSTRKGPTARSEWVGKHSWKFPEGTYHMHARYLKGEIMWVISTRASALCKVEGRCRVVTINDVHD